MFLDMMGYPILSVYCFFKPAGIIFLMRPANECNVVSLAGHMQKMIPGPVWLHEFATALMWQISLRRHFQWIEILWKVFKIC